MVGDYWNSRQLVDESLQLGFRLSVVSALGAQQKWVKSVLMNCKAPSDLALPLCDTRMFHTEASERWWLAVAGFSRGDPVFISELQASKYVYTSLSSARRDFLRSGNFQPKIKKRSIDCADRKSSTPQNEAWMWFEGSELNRGTLIRKFEEATIVTWLSSL